MNFFRSHLDIELSARLYVHGKREKEIARRGRLFCRGVRRNIERVLTVLEMIQLESAVSSADPVHLWEEFDGNSDHVRLIGRMRIECAGLPQLQHATPLGLFSFHLLGLTSIDATSTRFHSNGITRNKREVSVEREREDCNKDVSLHQPREMLREHRCKTGKLRRETKTLPINRRQNVTETETR